MPDEANLHNLATRCGAMTLGEPPQYLFTIEQLAALVSEMDGSAPLERLQERLNKVGREAR